MSEPHPAFLAFDISGEPPVHDWTWPAQVLKFEDGDSFWAYVDDGKRRYEDEPLRLAGVNCPERDTEAGKAAAAFTKQWLLDAQARGITSGKRFPLLIRTYKATREREKYGRWLVVVWRIGDVESLNAALLRNGHAVLFMT